MKIISWNVNGLRAVHRKGNFTDVLAYNPDILCLQEVKATPDQLPVEARSPAGYVSFFNVPKEKKGYSGVATYARTEPGSVIYGMEVEEFDTEGRLLATHFDNIVLFNIYFPNGGGGPARLEYKLNFYDAFLAHTEDLRQQGKSIIVCGDINTAHEEIDLARPKENATHTGFLPEERAWLDEVTALGYIDTYRYLYPNKKDAYTYWDMKTGARDRNVGWRIDYFFVSPDLQKKIKGAEMLTNVYGSDHCPIVLDIDI